MAIGKILNIGSGGGAVVNKKVYGVKRNLASESMAWERTNGSIGKIATASIGTTAGMSDFDTCYPWSEMKRETLSTSDVMVWIPKFYFQRYIEDGYEYINISQSKRDGYFEHIGSGKYIGAYETSSNKYSKSGVAPTASQTRATFRTNAASKGAGWSQTTPYVWSAVTMLYLVEFASNDSQGKIGRGYCDGNSAAINTGSCDSVPNLTGRPAGTDGKTGVVYRGIENPWGNIWEFVDGINFNGGTYYVCTDSSKFADDTSTNYIQLNYSGSASWGSSYITKLGVDERYPWAMLPEAAGSGSPTTYFGDGVWSASGWRVLRRGGRWSSGSLDGLFASDLDGDSSGSGSIYGSRLLYSPS